MRSSVLDQEDRPIPPSDEAGIYVIAIEAIRVSSTPRTVPIDDDHVVVLMQNLDVLPPVALEEGSLVLVDGIHRLEASRRAGRDVIRAVLLRGTKCEMLIESIRRNNAHGKPLTLPERERAAELLLRQSPEWSDRRIAEICALSPTTVGRVRAMASLPLSGARIGRDGRTRQHVGVRHPDPVPSEPDDPVRRSSPRLPFSSSARPALPPIRPTAPIARSFGSDAACASSSDGVGFAEWMDRVDPGIDAWSRWVDVVPLSRVYIAADEARRRAAEWESFAGALEARPKR